jgi:hypothetical protein
MVSQVGSIGLKLAICIYCILYIMYIFCYVLSIFISVQLGVYLIVRMHYRPPPFRVWLSGPAVGSVQCFHASLCDSAAQRRFPQSNLGFVAQDSLLHSHTWNVYRICMNIREIEIYGTIAK